MSTKYLYVRDNWAELTRRIAREKALLWRLVIGGPIVTVAFIFILRILQLSAPTSTVFLHGVYFCFFYALVVWYVLRNQANAVQVAGGIYAGSLSISLLASYLALDYVDVSAQAGSDLPIIGLVGIALFPLNWLLLRTVAYEHPRRFHTVGFTYPSSKWHLGYGVLAGCLLAGHFFFTGRLADLFIPAWKPWPFVLWQLSFTIGLRSLSEELFFRGLIFQQLYQIRHGGFWMASVVATASNMLPYVAIVWHGDLAFAMVTLFYVAALGMVNAVLYRVSNSIGPGVVNSVVFHLLTIFYIQIGV